MPKDTIKILHTGDVHLDSPFSRMSIEKSEERRGELRATFSSMMRYAREKDVDIILIPGDLFDRDFATSATAELLSREFSAMPKCRIVISPGNHDPYTPGGIYAPGRLPKNVHVFRSEALSYIAFEDLGVTVYGWAFCSDTHSYSPIADAHVAQTKTLNLLSCHCDLDAPLSKYCPVTLHDIEAFGAHYAALAHRHIPGEVKKVGKTTYAYCGCPEGRSFDECGVGGAYLVTARHSSAGWSVESERLQFARRRYASVKIDVSGAERGDAAARAISECIRKNSYGEETALRVTLTGNVAPTFTFPTKIDPREVGLYMIEVRDETAPLYDSEYLERDMTVRGELYRYLRPALTSGKPEERERAARALRIGLAALSRADFTSL